MLIDSIVAEALRLFQRHPWSIDIFAEEVARATAKTASNELPDEAIPGALSRIWDRTCYRVWEDERWADMKIVIIDDDAILCKTLKRCLTGRGFKVDWFTQPLGNLSHYLAFDAVIADWEPHGPRVVASCKKQGVPVLIHSGNVEATLEHFPEVPRVSKPCPPGKLEDYLRLLVGK